MASQANLDSCTDSYVNLVSYNKYASRISDPVYFNDIKEMVGQYINSKAWPAPKAKHGLALLVCHYLALDTSTPTDDGVIGGDLVKGPVVGETVGDMSVQYDRYSQAGAATEVKGFELWLLQTVYGKEFLHLKRSFKPAPSVT